MVKSACFLRAPRIKNNTQLEPPTPLVLKEGRTFRKLSHQGGGMKFFARKGDKPEKGELMQKQGVGRGGCHFFLTLQFNHIYCVWGGSKVPFITFWIFNLLSQPFKILIQVFIVLKLGIICIFLIRSGSIQKMLTVLFNLV